MPKSLDILKAEKEQAVSALAAVMQSGDNDAMAKAINSTVNVCPSTIVMSSLTYIISSSDNDFL